MGVRFFPTVIASMFGTLLAFGAAFFLFVIMLAGLAGLASSGQGTPTVRPGSVLVVPVTGFIPEATPENPFAVAFGRPGMTTLHEVTAAIRKAADDERITAIWLQPRGSMNAWASLEEIRSALHDFHKSGKPVIATSGAGGYSERDYFVAAAAHHVFSPPAARFEMNGFVIVLQFMSRLLEKLDVDVEAIRAGNFKSAVEPFTQEGPSEENRLQVRSILDAHTAAFKAAILEHERIDADLLDDIFEEGSITSADAAYELGLIDSLLVDDEASEFLKGLLGVDGPLPAVTVKDYAGPGIAGSRSGSDGTIAVVNLLGTIMPGRSGRDDNPLFGGSDVGSKSVTEMLKKLREDNTIDAVVVRINSPGGSAAASDVIWRAVAQTAEIKPVIASLGDVAASGGYYIAAGADIIVADPTTITGSIGVFSLLLDVSGLMEEKIGLTHEAVTTGPHADMLTGLRPLTDRERTMLTSDVDEIYDRFTRIVSDDRDLDLDRVLEISQGRVWSGYDALKIGLVDSLGGLETALGVAADAAGLDLDNVEVTIYPRPQGLFEAFFEVMGTAKADILTRIGWDGPAGWLVRQTETLHEIKSLHGNPQARLPVSVIVE